MDDKSSETLEKILQMVEPLVTAEGKELVEAEFRREGMGWVLRLFIDQEGGITVDDCAQVSRVIGDMLDVADVIRATYHLEVSSPGLNRPLRKPEHFQSVIGKIVDVRTTAPVDGRRRFKGLLTDISADGIRMECDGTPYEVPLRLLERARLCYFDSVEQPNPR
jgi:ribosome maturation factor RimP